MLLVQILETKWTKASRGAEEASVRNQVPVCLEFPPGFDSTGGAVHHVSFGEADQFTHRSSTKALPNPNERQKFPGVTIDQTESGLKVDFHWDFFAVGAPERRSHPIFNLKKNEYGRFSFNGRLGSSLSDGRDWTYFMYTYNILLAEQFVPSAFIRTPPDRTASELADLL